MAVTFLKEFQVQSARQIFVSLNIIMHRNELPQFLFLIVLHFFYFFSFLFSISFLSRIILIILIIF